MKKILLLLCIIILVGCRDKEVEEKPNVLKEETGQTKTQEKNSSEKDATPYQVRLPKKSFVEMTDEEISSMLEADGAQEITISEDVITYTVPKAVLNNKKQEMNQQILSMVSQINEGKIYSSIKKVEVNDTFSTLKVYVNQEQFEESFDRLAIFSLVTSISYMNHFQGITDYTISVDYFDQSTNELVDQVVYPEQE